MGQKRSINGGISNYEEPNYEFKNSENQYYVNSQKYKISTSNMKPVVKNKQTNLKPTPFSDAANAVIM